MTSSILCPAKINLFLDVLNKRPDGYHNINSVMQSVSLYDEITLDLSEIENGSSNIIEISCSENSISTQNDNIVFKVANAFFEKTKITAWHVKFHIEKNIPIGAGMAGGSADGAGALKLLNNAFNNPLSDDELLCIGEKTGADIPFCLTNGTCICQNIGDKISKLPTFSGILLICAIDSSSVSTPVAFSLLDKKYGTDCTYSADISKVVDAINGKDIFSLSKSLYNKFESVIESENESISSIKKIMLQNGATGTLMSGSGPSVFGIFPDEQSRLNADIALKNSCVRTFLCESL